MDTPTLTNEDARELVRDPNVPYELLARAEGEARDAHPGADRYKALWTPASSYECVVEVWRNERASTFLPECGR